jgi:hypothetical protein
MSEKSNVHASVLNRKEPISIFVVMAGDGNLSHKSHQDFLEIQEGLLLGQNRKLYTTVVQDYQADESRRTIFHGGRIICDERIADIDTNDIYEIERNLMWSSNVLRRSPSIIIYWGHNDGGISIGPDSYSGNSTGVTTAELASMIGRMRVPPKSVLFDACLSANILTIDALSRQGVQYFAGPSDIISWDGNHYKTFFKQIVPDISHKVITELFIKSFHKKVLTVDEIPTRVAGFTNLFAIMPAVLKLLRNIDPQKFVDHRIDFQYEENNDFNLEVNQVTKLAGQHAKDEILQFLTSPQTRIAHQYCNESTGLRIWKPKYYFQPNEIAEAKIAYNMDPDYADYMARISAAYTGTAIFKELIRLGIGKIT